MKTSLSIKEHPCRCGFRFRGERTVLYSFLGHPALPRDLPKECPWGCPHSGQQMNSPSPDPVVATIGNLICQHQRPTLTSTSGASGRRARCPLTSCLLWILPRDAEAKISTSRGTSRRLSGKRMEKGPAPSWLHPTCQDHPGHGLSF